MKKLFFATLVLIALASATVASAKDKNKFSLNDLTNALKQANNATVKTTDFFKKVTFTFNRKRIDAFYDNESNDLLGFSVPIDTTDLPQGSMENIQKRYTGWILQCAMIYIKSDGDTNYYVALKKTGGNLIAVHIAANGKATFFSHMPYYQHN